jgi:hypothetical protein
VGVWVWVCRGGCVGVGWGWRWSPCGVEGPLGGGFGGHGRRGIMGVEEGVWAKTGPGRAAVKAKGGAGDAAVGRRRRAAAAGPCARVRAC